MPLDAPPVSAWTASRFGPSTGCGGPGGGPDRGTADEWLLAALAGGPRPAKELQEEARAAGYCARTLERAKRRLGEVARRVRQDGQARWQWSDPALPHGAGRRG